MVFPFFTVTKDFFKVRETVVYSKTYFEAHFQHLGANDVPNLTYKKRSFNES